VRREARSSLPLAGRDRGWGPQSQNAAHSSASIAGATVHPLSHTGEVFPRQTLSLSHPVAPSPPLPARGREKRRRGAGACSHFVLDNRLKLSYIVTCPGSRGARSRGVARCGAGTRSRDRPRKPAGGRPCVPGGCAVRLKEPCAGGRSVPHTSLDLEPDRSSRNPSTSKPSDCSPARGRSRSPARSLTITGCTARHTPPADRPCHPRRAAARDGNPAPHAILAPPCDGLRHLRPGRTPLHDPPLSDPLPSPESLIDTEHDAGFPPPWISGVPEIRLCLRKSGTPDFPSRVFPRWAVSAASREHPTCDGEGQGAGACAELDQRSADTPTSISSPQGGGGLPVLYGPDSEEARSTVSWDDSVLSGPSFETQPDGCSSG
jgi:hypothetical protein